MIFWNYLHQNVFILTFILLRYHIVTFIQVAQLRQRFYHSIAPGGLAGDRRGVVPASAFSISAQHIWKVIRENKDLDLPAHKVFNYLIFGCYNGLSSQ